MTGPVDPLRPSRSTMFPWLSLLPHQIDRFAAFGDPLPVGRIVGLEAPEPSGFRGQRSDRKSTRLNSSHQIISYAVFCLKKKKKKPSVKGQNYDSQQTHWIQQRV